MRGLTVLSALSLAPGIFAWGNLGHETVALIAQDFVSSATKTWAQNILQNKSDTYLADVSTWADTYRRQKGGGFSAPFHFIDAEDSPPSTCNVDYNRDCGSEGCIVSALQNYTSRVQTTSLPALERTNALKFIVHFLGDIHQPLHDEAIEVGGNKINVTYAGKATNLHSIWDTQIPEQLVGGYSLQDAKEWAGNLTMAIKGGVYKNEKDKWLAGMDTKDTVKSAMIWASDANAFVCSKVMPGGVSAVQKGDLSKAYYDSVTDTVELQIARAGYRLAGWLNLLATGNVTMKVSRRADLYARAVAAAMTPSLRNEFSVAKLARREFGYDCRHH